MRKKLVDGPVR